MGNGRSPNDDQPTVSNLIAGTYTVSVTDNVGCGATRAFTVTIPQKPTLALVKQDASCSDKPDGTLKVIATPPVGAAVSAYNWSNGGVLDMITTLKADTYRITVTLNNGCVKDTFAVVNAPQPIVLDTAKTSVKNPTCFGYDDGQIILGVKGGTPGYIFNWSGGQPIGSIGSSVFGSLKAGAYEFTVTDFNGCTPLVVPIPLIAPPDITVAFTEIVGTTCYGVCNANISNGKATAIPSGGPANTGIYTYVWSSGETTSRAIELCGSFQAVTVSDGTCFKKETVDIPQPLPFVFQTPAIEEPSCFGSERCSCGSENFGRYTPLCLRLE